MAPLPILIAFTTTGLFGATFTVSNTNDTGSGSFRQALVDANASPGADQISFGIPGNGPFTLRPATAFPSVTGPVTIDATTQTSYAGSPKVELNGSLTPAGSHGLYLLTSNCVVRGLAISRFKRDGIRIENGGGHLVAGNFLGPDLSGTTATGNGEGGITVLTAGNTIGGDDPTNRNLISGNTLAGVSLLNATASGNVVLGNYIGTDATGAIPLGNKTHGILLEGARTNTLGGPTAGARNLISGNLGSGVYLTNATGNWLAGNLIGTAVTGAAGLGNAVDGVSLLASAGNRIGGTNVNARNLISGNGQDGVFIWGTAATGNWVQGNFVGTASNGTARLPNGNNGILCNGAPANLIGGLDAGARNLISGNTWDGVFLFGRGASNNVVQGNFVGTSVTGTVGLSNGIAGISIEDGTANLIGGPDPAARNLFSGNLTSGVLLYGAGTSNNVVQGNFMGTDLTGTARVPNTLSGVEIVMGPSNLIGGATAGAGNLISGNTDTGIFLSEARGNRIIGNRVGSDVTGTRALGNSWAGLEVIDSPGTVIGGETPGLGNQVSGNGYMGISIQNSASTGITVQGNLVGTQPDGLSALPNAFHNLAIWGDSGGNLIGGETPGAGNVIAFASLAGYDGLRILDGSLNNRIRGNSFFGNGGTNAASLGIDLGADGLTPNDGCDRDRGANQLQNFPTLVSAAGGNQTTIQGTLTSVANQAYLIQFYASPSCDASTYGEGSTYLGATTVNTDGSCNASFTVILTTVVPSGSAITATATDSANNTSEFSACVTLAGPPSILTQPASRTNALGTTASFTVEVAGTAPLTFQWRKNGTNLVNGGNVAGATTNALTLANVSTNDAGNYTLRVANQYGSVTSAPAALTIISPLTITLQPASRTNLAGTTATFTVEASGVAPLVYQWKKGGSNLLNGGNVSGATTNSLTLTSVTTNDAASYSVVITNLFGSVTSAPVTLTVLAPPLITLQPASRTNHVGTPATFTAQATGVAPLIFQWRKNGTALTNGVNVAGATTLTLTLPNVALGDAANYTLVVTNSAGSVTSAVAVLTVVPPPKLSISLSNGQLTLTWPATAVGFALQQTANLAPPGLWATVPDPVFLFGGEFRISLLPASGNKSYRLAWQAEAPPGITLQPTSRTNHLGTRATFTGQATGSAPLYFQWRKNGAALTNGGNVTGATSSTLALANVGPTDAANYTVVITNSSGSVTSTVAVLTVIPPPKLNLSYAAGQITLAWPVTAEEFALQQTASLSPPIVWTVGPNPPALVGGEYRVSLTPGSSARFYRLLWP